MFLSSQNHNQKLLNDSNTGKHNFEHEFENTYTYATHMVSDLLTFQTRSFFNILYKILKLYFQKMDQVQKLSNG